VTRTASRNGTASGSHGIGFAAAALLGALAAAPAAFATDGYFSHGYGMKAKGRGGASIALTDDAFGGANNPATIGAVDDQLALGLDIFSPQRRSARSGLGPGLDGSVKSGHTVYLIPEFAYKRSLSERLAAGVTVYGNGGLATAYPGGQFNCGQGPANMLCGAGRLGVDLSQLIVAPSLAFAATPRQLFGIAPLLGYQRFEATGLQAFAGLPGLSSDPAHVTNNGHESSTGLGVRVGYFSRIGPRLAIGATYASKVSMSRFKRYAGLFEGHGGFDIPDNFGVGLAWNPRSSVTVALDYTRINLSNVKSVGNSSLVPAPLGSDDGPGFGWKDVNAWKLGLDYARSERWTWRAGYNHSDNPIGSRDVTFNILAPGVITDHVTLGATYTTAAGGQITVACMHAFDHSQQGASILPVFLGGAPGGNERISMYENSLGIQYRWR
jgi:long-chain fatty acid transport protein